MLHLVDRGAAGHPSELPTPDSCGDVNNLGAKRPDWDVQAGDGHSSWRPGATLTHPGVSLHKRFEVEMVVEFHYGFIGRPEPKVSDR